MGGILCNILKLIIRKWIKKWMISNLLKEMMRMGEELGIPTPYNEYTYHMIKALAEKNDGLLDYQGERDKTTWAK